MATKKIYPEVNPNPSFPEIEEKIIHYWEKEDCFKNSVESRPAKLNGENNEFIFYDGPPFANGLPHYGHLLTGFIKDAYARYQTIKGKRVERRFGWDCHGLPAEMGAEKELGISGRLAVHEYGIDKFNEACRRSVMKYTEEWKKYVTRQARWVDFDNSYQTMDKNFMESVIWAFSKLYQKGLVYESMRVMPYSWACETPLSNFETRLDNSYRQRADKAITVSFLLKRMPNILEGFKERLQNNNNKIEYRILAWTTTPWTLPSNLALALGPEIEYVAAKKDNICYIIGKFAFEQYKETLGLDKDSIITIFTGKQLVGENYYPLFEYFKDQPNSFKILSGEFVEEGDGTGIVHLAPGFGEDDQILCDQHGIDIVCPVDNSGKFTKEVSDFYGLLVFDANDKIIIKLKEQGSWHKTEQYIHNYPHCWRTDTPLIYKAVPSWYVKVTDFKDRMTELNQQINWIPNHIKDGLFGKWLENAKDWSISRNRFWGTPIPIWKSDNPEYPRIDVYGSIEELEKDFNVKIIDLHRPYIDELTRPNPDDPTGKSTMRRVEDVFDCWFESGSMPYGQAHYPFDNKEWFEQHFPADFIVEYTAQTRGWFYTLMVLGAALFDKPPFLNCICHGVILDVKGQKLSKRLNNYVDPIELFNKYGADALRYAMLSSSVVKGQELLIDKEGNMIREVLRLYIKPIWNAYNFFVLYANADNIKAEISYESNNELDKYILSKLKSTLMKIDNSLAEYDTYSAYSATTDFFEVLNNWYIRRSRTKFWDFKKTQEKLDAYNTLYTCIEHMMRAVSPIIPLISEEIYQGITGAEYNSSSSVHLTDFPEYSAIIHDLELAKNMDKVRDICSTALNIRNEENVRVRQPLSNLKVILANTDSLSNYSYIIKDELNVKEVIFKDNLQEFADKKLHINFPVLGKRLPHKMKKIISDSKQGNWQHTQDGLKIADEILFADEFEIKLIPKYQQGAKALQYSQGLAVLDLEISDQLKKEGYARDLIRLIQQARKDAELDISDSINLEILSKFNEITESVNANIELIEQQTLGKFAKDLPDSAFVTEFDISGMEGKIKFTKL